MNHTEDRSGSEIAHRAEESHTPQDRDVANGIVVNVHHLNDIRIEVRYRRSSFTGGRWHESNQRRTLSLAINSSCPFSESVMDVKRSADALGIDFGDTPRIVVENGEDAAMGTNVYDLCKVASRQLGWGIAWSDS